jgi:hypothetical protein
MKIEDPFNIVQENDMDSAVDSWSHYSFGSNGSEDNVEDLGLMRAKPFDMNILKESIETGSKILNHIEGKNVVLVI